MRLSLISFIAICFFISCSEADNADDPSDKPIFKTGHQIGTPTSTEPADIFRQKALETYPDMTLNGPEGETMNLAERVAFFFEKDAPFVIIHFWATWCPSCIDELKYFSQHHAQAVNDTTNTLAPVISVALENNTPEDIKRFLDEKAHASHLDAFTASLNDAVTCCKTRGLPLTLFIHKDGSVFKRIEGQHPWHKKGAFSE